MGDRGEGHGPLVPWEVYVLELARAQAFELCRCGGRSCPAECPDVHGRSVSWCFLLEGAEVVVAVTVCEASVGPVLGACRSIALVRSRARGCCRARRGSA